MIRMDFHMIIKSNVIYRISFINIPKYKDVRKL